MSNLSLSFVRVAVGGSPGEVLDFLVESRKEVVPVAQRDLDSLLADQHLDRVGLLLADIQAHGTVLLERASESLASGRERFLIVSTHSIRYPVTQLPTDAPGTCSSQLGHTSLLNTPSGNRSAATV